MSGPRAGDGEEARPNGSVVSLAVGSIGVVYGDIGTSPLYAMKEAVSAGAQGAAPTAETVVGVCSLMLWALVAIVTLKYVLILLRADNKGEGGIFALMVLGQAAAGRHGAIVLTLGIAGAAFFYGDCIITPAISVLSAIEGLSLVHPSFGRLVLPLCAIILIGLFAVQSRGTEVVGRWFGPITLVWFGALALGGLARIPEGYSILLAISPLPGLHYIAHHGLTSLTVLGAVFLTVTGAEALYADLGHFGRKPIQLAWLTIVFPALVLNYLGQGALLIADPGAIENPFYRLYPEWALIPMVLLSTVATVIASQAVITGAFSLTQQAVQLGLLPRLSILHTSADVVGQIYMPRVNILLLLGVLFVVFMFKSSSALASAYGISVTATMILTTCIGMLVVRKLWAWPLWKVLATLAPLLLVEQMFFIANATKVWEGGWFPLLVAGALFGAMATWHRGVRVLARITRKHEADLDWFVEKLSAKPPFRVHGTAIFMTGDPALAPAAMLHNLKHNHILHERNIIMSMRSEPVPRVAASERIEIRRLSDLFIVVTARYGFMEQPDVPRIIEQCRRKGLHIEMAQCSFFVSRRKLRMTTRSQMPAWQERLFIAMSGFAQDATVYFRIPSDRVVEVGTQVLI